MYCEHYGLQLMPFENSPDPRFLYTAEDHREALAGIEYTVRMRKGVVLVSGEIGAGKTIITHVLKERLEGKARTILVRQGHTSAVQFLRHVCMAMKLRVRPNADRGEMLNLIERSLIEHQARGVPVVLIIDEAQMMSKGVMHEIRMLSNIETATRKLIQIVLLGQPDLRQKLLERELDPLRQRVALSHHLNALSLDGTREYIQHRLKVAANNKKHKAKFEDDAIAKIFEYTGGVPRLINFLADNCLLVGYVKGKNEIGTAVVEHVTNNMMLEQPVHGATEGDDLERCKAAA